MEWRNFQWNCNRFTISPSIVKILVALESGDGGACARWNESRQLSAVYMRQDLPGRLLFQVCVSFEGKVLTFLHLIKFFNLFSSVWMKNRHEYNSKRLSLKWFQNALFFITFCRHLYLFLLLSSCCLAHEIMYWLLRADRREARKLLFSGAWLRHIDTLIPSGTWGSRNFVICWTDSWNIHLSSSFWPNRSETRHQHDLSNGDYTNLQPRSFRCCIVRWKISETSLEIKTCW